MANISITFSEIELNMLKEVQLYRSKQEDLILSKSDILREALDLLYKKMKEEQKEGEEQK